MSDQEPNNPTVSPAPQTPPNTPITPTDQSKEKTQNKFITHEIELVTDEKGLAQTTTALITGKLEFIRVNQSMPSQLVIKDEQDTYVLYNNHLRLNEDLYIRHRTQDQHGKYYNVPSKIILNERLIIQIRGSPKQSAKIKMVLT